MEKEQKTSIRRLLDDLDIWFKAHMANNEVKTAGCLRRSFHDYVEMLRGRAGQDQRYCSISDLALGNDPYCPDEIPDIVSSGKIAEIKWLRSIASRRYGIDCPLSRARDLINDCSAIQISNAQEAEEVRLRLLRNESFKKTNALLQAYNLLTEEEKHWFRNSLQSPPDEV